MLPRGAETPKSKFSCFLVARKRQKVIFHTSAWRRNTKKQIFILPRGAETPKSKFSYFRVARKRQKVIFHTSAWRGNAKKQIFNLPRGAETPKSKFSTFRVARKHQKANFHTSAWRGNDLKEMIKESPTNINLRGLYHSHSYAINTGVMEVLLVTFSCSIQVYIGYLKPNKSFYMKLAA